MKKLFIRIILFSVLVIGLLALIVAGPYPRKFGYNYLGGDYIKSAWNYQRIFEDTTGIDIAFMGTSHTLNGIIDSVLDMQIDTTCNKPLDVVNLGLKDIGSNLHYVLARDLLVNKKPRLLVMEVREIESHHGHKYFSYLATAGDILTPPLLVNVNLISDIKNGVYSRAEYLRQLTGLEKSTEHIQLHPSRYGFEPNTEMADSGKFDKIVTSRNERFVYHMPPILQTIGFHYSKTYIKRIACLAKDNNCKLVFLYLPYYGVPLDKPMLYDFYSQYGEVWIPAEINKSRNLFINPTHLSHEGAEKLTQWINEHLAAALCSAESLPNLENQ